MLDDDEYIRAVLSDMLGNDGYEVSAAESGEAAVEGFRKAHELHQPVDVVVLDLRIPEGMQGNDVLELIRSIDGSIKAVALTGDINHPVVARYREYGFQGVLLKPFLSAELVQAIEEARV